MDDLIQRQAVLDYISRILNQGTGKKKSFEFIQKYVEKLSPVTPQSKTGHWIDDNENEIDAQYGRHLYKCSKCNEYADMFVGGTEDWWDLEKPNYCPNCGAKMVEPQESSEG